MVLMTIDHASGAFNAGRLTTDIAVMYHPGMPLPPAQFFTRWITHLCAPTFVFLAGAALALSVEKRRAAGDSERAFFFQAEDGIRDWSVTGVQTCALPI